MGMAGDKMIVGVIQARMGSKRLPGKSILPLAGKPLLYRFIERVLKAKMIDKVILATTKKQEDDCLCDIAKELGIDVFRGSDNDLVGRIYNAAKQYNPYAVVRLCADNPLIEDKEIDRIIARFMISSKTSVKRYLFSNTHNIQDNGYPDGLGAEVYLFGDLKWLAAHEHNIEYREHPHKYFYEDNSIKTLPCPDNFKGYSHLKLDVNTQEEYEYIKTIYDKFGNNNFHFLDYAGGL